VHSSQQHVVMINNIIRLHLVHEMPPLAIDDPVAWVCHVGDYSPDGATTRPLLHYCSHLFL